ncbi:hypothetical protein ATK86_3244 [Nocardia fluminea]|uniref:Membrane protein YfhO n=1 Tax=Nocardia fluminea TaxID=134984 RepID=A0A2N3VB71_9NOCA|nr:hypothetical protein ATK86_3244 [Nocardia fluminea]
MAGYCALLTMLIVGPLAGSGYLLLRDAVSTPRSFLTDSALGVGAAAPRAVPQDAVLAVLSPVIDGGILVKAILIVALWSAGYGAAVLARRFVSASTGAQLVAATLALWNTYVAERLLQGHWSLLAGYAALPWTALAAARIRTATSRTESGEGAATEHRFGSAGSFGGWAALTASFAAAGLTPTGSLLAAVIGFALVGRRAFVPAVALWIVTCAPWLTATALGSGAEPSDPAGVSAFAARAEPWLGTLGSLAGLGGIWNGEAVPASRTTPLALIGTLILLGIVACGVRAVWAIGRDGRALLVIAAVAIVLPALGATSAGLAAGEWLVVHVPGAGLLRDTQKYVALAMPAYALCAAAACRTVTVAARRILAHDAHAAPASPEPHSPPRAAGQPPTEAPVTTGNRAAGQIGSRPAAIVFIVLLTLPLADLAWGVGGAMRPVHYPAGWQEVVDHIDAPGDIAVLPAGMFRRFPYSGTAPVLDPAPRILPNDVLQTGELRVRGYAVTGEGNRARTVEEALLRGAPATDLAALGVGWILLEHTTPGPVGASEKTLATAELAYRDADLALYRIPGPAVLDTATPTQRGISTAAHLLWAALLLAGLTGGALRPSAQRHPASRSSVT